MNLTLMQEFYDFNPWLDLAGKGGKEGWKEGRKNNLLELVREQALC